jgi:hypothetical protein
LTLGEHLLRVARIHDPAARQFRWAENGLDESRRINADRTFHWPFHSLRYSTCRSDTICEAIQYHRFWYQNLQGVPEGASAERNKENRLLEPPKIPVSGNPIVHACLTRKPTSNSKGLQVAKT